MYVEDNKIPALFTEDRNTPTFPFNFTTHAAHRSIPKVVFSHNFLANFNCTKDVTIEFFCFRGTSLITSMTSNRSVRGKGRGNKSNRSFTLMTQATIILTQSVLCIVLLDNS